MVAILSFFTSFPWVAGCGGGEETAAPEKMEESRQQTIDRNERMRQEMNKK
jgi:hypothetical protein